MATPLLVAAMASHCSSRMVANFTCRIVEASIILLRRGRALRSSGKRRRLVAALTTANLGHGQALSPKTIPCPVQTLSDRLHQTSLCASCLVGVSFLHRVPRRRAHIGSIAHLRNSLSSSSPPPLNTYLAACCSVSMFFYTCRPRMSSRPKRLHFSILQA